MMKKALHMGTRDTERAERIFLEDLRRPKRRTTRRARSMLMGKLRGPRTTRDVRTTAASKRDQPLAAKSRREWERALMSSSARKTKVKATLSASRVCLMLVGLPSGWRRLSCCSCASAAEAQKFCSVPSARVRGIWMVAIERRSYRYD